MYLSLLLLLLEGYSRTPTHTPTRAPSCGVSQWVVTNLSQPCLPADSDVVWLIQGSSETLQSYVFPNVSQFIMNTVVNVSVSRLGFVVYGGAAFDLPITFVTIGPQLNLTNSTALFISELGSTEAIGGTTDTPDGLRYVIGNMFQGSTRRKIIILVTSILPSDYYGNVTEMMMCELESVTTLLGDIILVVVKIGTYLPSGFMVGYANYIYDVPGTQPDDMRDILCFN